MGKEDHKPGGGQQERDMDEDWKESNKF